ncbi:MAG: membrane protein insertion efficiency factor YidD [Hyphomicrobium sp.]
MTSLAGRICKVPIHLYRWTLKPLIGLECRHLPTCSEYALEAIDRNGAWKGLWLMLSRLSRCHPWGTAGYDPVPDLSGVRQPLWRAYRYGLWNGRHLGCKVGCKGGEV